MKQSGWLSRLQRGHRPALTLLFVGSRQTVRADVDSHGILLSEPDPIVLDCLAIHDLPAVVSGTLSNSTLPGQLLWILYEDWPVYALSLPSAQLAGLSDEQCAQALSYELEQETGANLAQQQLIFALLNQQDDLNGYWVSHAPRSLIEQLQKVATKFHCRLGGLLHPGAMPSALSHHSQEQSWARLESWPNASIGVAGDRGQIKIQVFPSETRYHRLQIELDHWQKSLGDCQHWEILNGRQLPVFLADDAESFEQSHEPDLHRWLSLWAIRLAKSESLRTPILRPGEDPHQEIRYRIIGGIVAVLLCLAHLGWQNHRQSSLQAELNYRKNLETRVQTLQLGLKRTQERRNELKQQLNILEGGHAPLGKILDALRVRPATLLRELAKNASDGLIVEEVRTKSDAVSVKGVCLNVAEANDLATALQTHLVGLGWQVALPQKRDMALLSSGGPWEFEILLTDSGVAGFSSPEPTQSTQAEAQ